MARTPRPFEEYYIPEPNSGCWLWLGTLSEKGYGIIHPNTRAHRVSYELAKGKVPNGLVLDHLCRVRCCVNPDHLEAVTQGENVRRGLMGMKLRTIPPALRKERDAELRRAFKKRWRQTPAGKASRLRESRNRRARKAMEN